jgi:DNA uptake protein ComE-like DNA-binding protein
VRRATIYVMMVALALAGLSSSCSLGSMEKKYNDITGRSDKKETRVELNSARRKQLAALPGLTNTDADKIIAGRPYEKRRDLVGKGVLSEGQFEKIRDSVYVEHGKE